MVNIVLLAASRQGFKYCRNTEDISFATSSNDLTNQRLLHHVISRDYITHEFRVIPKHSPAARKGKLH